MRISIIIPTLNEEEYLPRILQDLEGQTFKDFEVIVADAGSQDNTRSIAKKYKAKVVHGGMPGVGRNNGARAAEGDFIFFFDADIRIPKNFLERAYNEMQKRYLDLATCEFKPISNRPIDTVMHGFANLSVKLGQFSKPYAPGFCILISKRLFRRINGFRENIKLAEDHDFVKRASKFRHLRVLDSTRIKVSVRRLNKEGRLNLIGKYAKVELYRFFKGELKKDFVEYEFGNYDKHDKNLTKLEHKLDKINKEYEKFIKKITSKKVIKKNFKIQMNKFRKQFDEAKLNFKKIVRKLK